MKTTLMIGVALMALAGPASASAAFSTGLESLQGAQILFAQGTNCGQNTPVVSRSANCGNNGKGNGGGDGVPGNSGKTDVGR
jgi:hypothetical protein